MAYSNIEKAKRMRALAAWLRKCAAQTGLLVYQAKMLAAARELERVAITQRRRAPRGKNVQSLRAG